MTETDMATTAPAARPASRSERELGARVRALREAAGVTGIELARLSGVTAGAISQIERGTGAAVAVDASGDRRRLGQPIFRFFVSGTEEQHIVVRSADRKRLKLPHSTVEFELLSPDLNRRLEVLEIKLQPGSATSAQPQPHGGEEEFMLIIKGRGGSTSAARALSSVPATPPPTRRASPTASSTWGRRSSSRSAPSLRHRSDRNRTSAVGNGPTAEWMEILRHHRVDYGLPGAAATVVDGGRIVWEAAEGEADPTSHRPVTADTLFRAGSITKLLTASAVHVASVRVMRRRDEARRRAIEAPPAPARTAMVRPYAERLGVPTAALGRDAVPILQRPGVELAMFLLRTTCRSVALPSTPRTYSVEPRNPQCLASWTPPTRKPRARTRGFPR